MLLRKRYLEFFPLHQQRPNLLSLCRYSVDYCDELLHSGSELWNNIKQSCFLTALHSLSVGKQVFFFFLTRLGKVS